jgi:hypothetical protein
MEHDPLLCCGGGELAEKDEWLRVGRFYERNYIEKQYRMSI